MSDEKEFKLLREGLKKEHHKAVHVTFAYRLGFEGEMEGHPTENLRYAGRPILNEMKSRAVTECIILVVRYFGGKKLGVPGLINAYKMAAADCLDKANIITVPIKESYNISCSETDMPMVMHELNKSGAHIMATDFAEICNFRIEFDRANAEKILSKLKTIWQIQLEHISAPK
jgi:putative IMPACT (imprinted ancient) family translation regulator